MRVALLFDHYGPYHLARLRGAMEAGLEMVGVEFYSRSRDYAWVPTHSRDLQIAIVSKTTEISKAEFRAALWALLDQSKPDAVTIPGWAGREALSTLEWCLTNEVPAIMMSESSAHDEARSPWKEWVKRRILACCPAALVGGRSHQTYLEKLGLKKEHISLGYDAVGNDYFTDGNRLIERSKSPSCGLFLASARFIEKKNLLRLIDAYAAYRQMAQVGGSNAEELWTFILLGDGELRSALEHRIDELSLRPYVSVPGFLQYQDLPAFYKKASAFIHASTTEQWGLVVNEAMASGLPVLVSNRCGCAPDLVHEEQNGFTFDPHDTKSMAKLMLKMTLMSNAERESMGMASKEIINQWGPERFGQGLRRAAETALSGGPRKIGAINRLVIKILSSR